MSTIALTLGVWMEEREGRRLKSLSDVQRNQAGMMLLRVSKGN